MVVYPIRSAQLNSSLKKQWCQGPMIACRWSRQNTNYGMLVYAVGAASSVQRRDNFRRNRLPGRKEHRRFSLATNIDSSRWQESIIWTKVWRLTPATDKDWKSNPLCGNEQAAAHSTYLKSTNKNTPKQKFGYEKRFNK